MLYLHPRDEQRYRDAKLPTDGLMSFRCKTCGNTRSRSKAVRSWPVAGGNVRSAAND